MIKGIAYKGKNKNSTVIPRHTFSFSTREQQKRRTNIVFATDNHIYGDLVLIVLVFLFLIIKKHMYDDIQKNTEAIG